MSPMKKRRLSTCESNNRVPLRVKAKIDTHWKNGTPLQFKQNVPVKRRETMACIQTRSSSSGSDENKEEMLVENDPTSNSNFLTPKVLKNLNNLSDNFSRFFSLMELSFKNSTKDETDTAIINKTIQDISDDVEKMNEIIDSLCTKTAKVSELLIAKNSKTKSSSSV